MMCWPQLLREYTRILISRIRWSHASQIMNIRDKAVAEESESVEFVEMLMILEGVQEFHYTLPPHRRCAAHTLNLIAVKDSQKAKGEAIFKGIACSSFGRCQALWNKQRSRVVADSIHSAFQKYLTTPNATRWNSMYDSVKCLVSEIEKHGTTTPDELTDKIELSRF